ncbi:hypothetical protein CQW23_30768 [Capsicum baccatum]|uniref:Uncharacterized protein n=1 Tax=Capsicum baccatum TaxID=33114 RepID=A0A2G2V9I8_CAPBA|nr:hypothetical protein CQW23_30768 [Capsicum baccatum]
MNFKADNNLLFSLSFYKSFLQGLDIFGTAFRTDDMFMEKEDANEASFCVYTATSPLPSEHPSTATSSRPYNHPITRIGNDLEALITEHVDEDNDINSIFDVLKCWSTIVALLLSTIVAHISTIVDDEDICDFVFSTSVAAFIYEGKTFEVQIWL